MGMRNTEPSPHTVGLFRNPGRTRTDLFDSMPGHDTSEVALELSKEALELRGLPLLRNLREIPNVYVTVENLPLERVYLPAEPYATEIQRD
jgi:hypothetical protein